MASDGARVISSSPPSFGPLIGRAGETVEILSLLTTARLFTLTGAGGSGKTRLAAQVAAESRDTFPDGARWVDLGALTDPALFTNVVAARCGIVDRGGSALLDTLAAALHPRRLLLVLDNCEHVLPECARVVEALLTACPDLHVVATSREAFALPGEVTWLVGPLRIPTQTPSPPSRTSGPTKRSRSSSLGPPRSSPDFVSPPRTPPASPASVAASMGCPWRWS